MSLTIIVKLLLQVVQETISANVPDDTVNLTFTKSDGTQVTQFIDFRSVGKL